MITRVEIDDVARDRAPFDCVVAADAAGGIGKDNDLPWPRLAEDLRHLRRLTTEAPAGRRNAVIMGRKTWDSTPAKLRPLPGRLNVVVSRRPQALPDGVLLAGSLDHALDLAGRAPGVDRLFVLGGAQIFAEAFVHPRCRDVYLTRIDSTFDADTFLPPLEPRFALAETLARHDDAGFRYTITRWRRVDPADATPPPGT